MPIKKHPLLAPDQLGLSLHDLIYIIVFRELNKYDCDAKQMHEHILHEMNTFAQTRHEKHLYDVLQAMQTFGWIENIGGQRKKVYRLTSLGREKQPSFERTYFAIVAKINQMARHFVSVWQGDTFVEAPIMSDDEIKVFNRLISVKHTARYMFLFLLHQQKTLTGTHFLDLMEQKHRWKLNSSYMYAIIRAIESADGGWVKGEWDNPRTRHIFFYSLTEEGRNALTVEGERALTTMKEIARYSAKIVEIKNR